MHNAASTQPARCGVAIPVAKDQRCRDERRHKQKRKGVKKISATSLKLKEIFETCTDTCETKESKVTFFIIFPVLFAFFHQFASEVPSTLPVLPETWPANWPGVLPGYGTFAGPPC